MQDLESKDTIFENWIWIDQDLLIFGAFSNKDLTDLQTKNQEDYIDENDDEKINVKITQRETRIDVKVKKSYSKIWR